MTTLRELLTRLEEFDEDGTIFASSPWTGDSHAVVIGEAADAGTPPGVEGHEYLLEVPLAKEVVEVWSQWRNGAEPTGADLVESVIHYAAHDAYLQTSPFRG